MLLLDCVTSVGGLRVSLDEWGVDAAYSGTQKCLGWPPGLSPISFSAVAARDLRVSVMFSGFSIGVVTVPRYRIPKKMTPCLPVAGPWQRRYP